MEQRRFQMLTVGEANKMILFHNSKYESIIKDISSGDIVLFSGKGSIFSSIIRTFSAPVTWTHIGILIRDPKTNLVYIIQSTYEKEPPDYFCKNGQPFLKTGPKLTPFQYVLNSYNGYSIAIRKLIYNDRNNEKDRKDWEIQFWDLFTKYFNKHCHKEYEQHYMELLKAAYSANKEIDTSSFFCTELVADLLMKLNIIKESASILSNNYNLWHFSSDCYSLSYVGKYYYTKEMFIYYTGLNKD